MTVSLAGRASTSFEIKGANLPLVALLLKSPDLDLLAQEFAARFGETPGFFENEPLVVDLAPLQAGSADAIPDFGVLLPLLRRYSLVPIAVRGGSPGQMAAAQAAGLVMAPDVGIVASRAPVAAPAPEPEQPAAAAAPAAPPVVEAASVAPVPSALVIDRPLRSGQQVYAKGRDLVLLSMVNAGAEVIADGHIHVYAPLRGRAIAGARGDSQARIFALAMEPELLSIAGVYRTSDVALPGEVWGKPTQVRLDGDAEGGKLVMQVITG